MKFTRRRRCSDFTNPKPTCYTKTQLIDLVKEWNKNNPNEKINKASSLSKTAIWKELRNRHKTDHEDKWVKYSNKTRRNLKCNRFAPKVPDSWESQPNTWLSDEDISKAMCIYEKKFKKFHFLEPAPIDFDTKKSSGKCAYSNLCNYTYKDLAKKYNSFGAIFNTDPHDKGGQHWIALFVNLKKGEIFYFDSVGDKPPKEVQSLINRFRSEGEKYLNIDSVSVRINKTRHQHGNTECGIYCLAFIHHMLTNGDFSIFDNERIPDNEIITLRSYFFDDIKGIYN
tara:strand:+ start:1360 stop:2208 length:849 start_codon:yes stop_codon:yes gene_type:complete